MVRECNRRFLDKNKNKDKNIARKLTVDEVMMNIIETDEQFTYRRDMENR